MRIIIAAFFLLGMLGFSSAFGQSVEYGNNEVDSYSSSMKSDNSTYLMWDRNDDGGGNFSNENTPKFFYWDNDDSKLHFLLDTGNMRRLNAKFNTVSIGTSSPSAPLHVYESSSSSGGSTMLLDAAVDQNPNVKFTLDGQNMANIRVNERGGDQLQFQVGSSLIEAMSITQQGNVGIGTVSPSSRLSVKGTAKAEEIIVEENIGADFVFEEDYPLPSLSEVEHYIKNQKHLPGIPSAEEMKRNGVKVGDLQMKLLQKIEELTLHTIRQQKFLFRQQEKIRSLNQEVKKLKKNNK